MTLEAGETADKITGVGKDKGYLRVKKVPKLDLTGLTDRWNQHWHTRITAWFSLGKRSLTLFCLGEEG